MAQFIHRASAVPIVILELSLTKAGQKHKVSKPITLLKFGTVETRTNELALILHNQLALTKFGRHLRHPIKQHQ